MCYMWLTECCSSFSASGDAEERCFADYRSSSVCVSLRKSVAYTVALWKYALVLVMLAEPNVRLFMKALCANSAGRERDNTLSRRSYERAVPNFENIFWSQSHDKLSFRKSSTKPEISRRTRASPIPFWRGEMHCLQIMWSDMPSTSHHYWGGGTRGWKS